MALLLATVGQALLEQVMRDPTLLPVLQYELPAYWAYKSSLASSAEVRTAMDELVEQKATDEKGGSNSYHERPAWSPAP